MQNRPVFVKCYICSRDIEVAPRGRIPETHAHCANYRDDCRRIPKSLALALAGADNDQAAIAGLRQVWRDLQSEMVTAWNLADNPRRKGRSPAR